jgi:hypothetical protein
VRCTIGVARWYLLETAAADCPLSDRATATSEKPMVRKADEILTDVLRSIGHSLKFYFEAAPNFLISVDKGPGKEHCSRTPRLNLSNVAVRYTNADAIAAMIGRQVRAEAT